MAKRPTIPPEEWTVPKSPRPKPDFRPIFVNGELTLHEWAKRAKVGESTLNRWWHGHRRPRGDRGMLAVGRLADVLGIDRFECLKMLLECGEYNRLHRMLGTPVKEIKSWSAPPIPKGFRRVPGKYPIQLVPITPEYRKLSLYRRAMRARLRAKAKAEKAEAEGAAQEAVPEKNTDPTR